MTDSQFEILRQELRAMRGDFQLDSKPDKAFVFQTLLTVNATFIALVGLALLIFRSFLVPA